MKKYIILLLVISLFGCDNMKKEVAEKRHNQIEYIKDKYGNCFATITYQVDLGAYGTSLATVPCNTIEQEFDNEKKVQNIVPK